MLTRMLTGCSAVFIGAGDELDFTDSGEVLRKGMTKFIYLRAPLHESLHQDGPLAPALLPEYPMASDIASNDDGDENSGELFSVSREDGE
jgi:hypothetical protein